MNRKAVMRFGATLLLFIVALGLLVAGFGAVVTVVTRKAEAMPVPVHMFIPHVSHISHSAALPAPALPIKQPNPRTLPVCPQLIKQLDSPLNTDGVYVITCLRAEYYKFNCLT
jgi:hypothetical protein